jgi:hypothetical protein
MVFNFQQAQDVRALIIGLARQAVKPIADREDDLSLR